MDMKKLLASVAGGKNKTTLIILAAAILLLIFSGFLLSPKKEAEEKTSPSNEVYYNPAVQDLEKQLAATLGKMEGVGVIDVMITYSGGVENVYAADSRHSQSVEYDAASGQESRKSYDSQNNLLTVRSDSGAETPLLTKQTGPAVSGVLIVCEGGGNERVVLAITEAVRALLDVSSNRICVVKAVSET